VTAHEAAARTRKAFKLLAVLRQANATAAEAAALPEGHRAVVAELAGCPAPSNTTWAVVVEMLRADEAGALARPA
jgi:hypothetical protein